MNSRLIACLLAGTLALGVTSTPAYAVTPVSELKDVSPDHWAYNAIQTVIERYQVMDGYADGTFRGSKTSTRYELAVMLAKVMAKMEERIAMATGQPVAADPGVNPEDLRTIARLQREFREELDWYKARLERLEGQ